MQMGDKKLIEREKEIVHQESKKEPIDINAQNKKVVFVDQEKQDQYEYLKEFNIPSTTTEILIK